jgi:predicted ArsR family transcriptional regulator
LSDDIARLAALGEPVRRELYRHVIAQDRPISREDAAAGVGVPHHVAKFHLDRLVADGLLDVEFRRPPGRTGPGAGRPAKVYRRSTRDIAVSLPERRYDLAGQVLAEAVTIAARGDSSIMDAVSAAAAAAGRRLAETVEPNTAEPDAAVNDLLARYGYEPRPHGSGLILGNCPFAHLAHEYTDLICGMNVALLAGALDRLGAGHMRAELDPGPGRCCVAIRYAAKSRS